jgi:hypothetical protein
VKTCLTLKVYFIHYDNTDINECDDDPCEVGYRCDNNDGSFSCICQAGYRFSNPTTCVGK